MVLFFWLLLSYVVGGKGSCDVLHKDERDVAEEQAEGWCFHEGYIGLVSNPFKKIVECPRDYWKNGPPKSPKSLG